MYPVIQHSRVLQVKAMVFTSAITAVFIAVFALITLYRPVVSVPQEETMLLDLSMVPLAETEISDNTPGLTQAAGQTTGVSAQNPNNQTRSQQQLPPNGETLFPGMQSDEDGTGKEGNADPRPGEPGKGDFSGISDEGGNQNYSLSGRNCIFKPVMNVEVQEEGKVEVEIWVDENGKVTRTRISEGNTNTNSPLLRKLALKNALQTKWTEKNGSPEQKGRISYKFVLR